MRKSKLIMCVVIGLITMLCNAQKWDTEEFIKKYNYQEVIGDIKNEDGILTPDKYGMYPDGKAGIHELISKRTKIPKKARRENIGGKVILRYIVDVDGYVTDIEVFQSAHKLLDKAAIKVLKLMKRWIPAQVNGEYVRIEYRQPFRFDI